MKDLGKSFLYKLRIALAYHDLFRNGFKPVSRCFIKGFRDSQMKAARSLRGKKQLEVAFFLTIPGMWKSDALFEAMLHDSRYHPYVVIYPYSRYKGFKMDEVRNTIEQTKQFIEQRGYEYIIPFDERRGKWFDLNKQNKQDVVFFSTPYKDTLPIYYLYHYRDTLTCYVPYSLRALSIYKTDYALIFHNLVGVFCAESELHRKMAIEHSRNQGVNVIVTGYPATEIFLRKDYVPKDQWKPQPHTKKKVIYASHHSIDKEEFPSVFLEICEEMFHIAEKFADTIQFVFKPHYLLKFKLQRLWGEEKTEAYYQRWNSLGNTQLVIDGYEELFLTSDAMIHDCGSFTTEYLYVKKPVIYLGGETDMTGKFNEFGIRSFNCHYRGKTGEDIERFLQEVVLEGKDPMRTKREQFFEDYLKPKDGILPSQKILKVLEEVING